MKDKVKKNYGLLCGIIICALVYVVFSWIFPTATITEGAIKVGAKNPIGLFGLGYFPTFTIDAFFKLGLSILAIGGFYGVMASTGVYIKLVDGLTEKVKKNSNLFIIILIIAFAVVNSLSGVPYALLITVPFFMAVVLKIGYSKLVAVASTVGAMLIGSLASTYGYDVAGIGANVLGTSVGEGVLSRLILLALVTGLYVVFVVANTDKDVKNSKKATEELEDDLFVGKKSKSKKSLVPMIIFFALTVVIAIVSMYNWNNLLKIDIFEKFYEDIIAIKVGDFEIVKNLLGITSPFGYWSSYELVVILVFASLIIGWIYNLKINEIFTSFIEGSKKFLKPAFYITIANLVLVLMFSSTTNSYILTWITDKLVGTSKDFNLLAVTSGSIIGGFFCNSFNYLFSTIGQVFKLTYGAEYYAIILFIVQSIYGVLMLILPTSLFLVSGLTIMNVSYKEWIKYIWKFLLEVFVIIIVIAIILVLVV